MNVKWSRIITSTLIVGLAISTLLVFRYMLNQPQDLQLNQDVQSNTLVQSDKPVPDLKLDIEVIAAKQEVVQHEEAPAFVGKEGDHPHPISKDHERLFNENALVGNVLGAIDIEDVEALRKLSQQHQEQYPEALMMQRGIDIIADCMEEKTEAVKYAAQSYYDAERASRLRRYVRRYCLEG